MSACLALIRLPAAFRDKAVTRTAERLDDIGTVGKAGLLSLVSGRHGHDGLASVTLRAAEHNHYE
jgi:hypothetical protein